MPEAGGTTGEVVRRDLKSCPGGFVKIRKLSYGEKVRVRKLAARYEVERKEADESRDSKDPDIRTTSAVDLEAVIHYQFKKCIVDHNLELKGRKIDFDSRADFAALDIEIGEEIENYIDELQGEKPESTDELAESKRDEGDRPLASVSSAPSPPEQK